MTRTKRVNRVNGRHYLWLIVLLVLSAMLLSPWITAPPAQQSASRQPEQAARPSPRPLDEDAEPVRLRVAAALGEPDFAALMKQSEEIGALRNIEVEWVRVDPSEAYDVFRKDARLGTAADVMLMPAEWVINFAVSGLLAPADSAFSGDGQSQQFAALTASLKWNGYIWGVPRDFDPYVLVWNMDALAEALGPSPDIPDNPGAWAELAEKSRAAANPVPFLALDRDEPLSLLAWAHAVAGERSDHIWEEKHAWNKTLLGDALSLLDRERDHAVFAGGTADIAAAVSQGGVIAAVLPYSSAKLLMDVSPHSPSLRMDLAPWKQPYVWPRSTVFTIYARTNAQEAATRWIAAMISEPMQLAHWMDSGKLPAQASLFERDFRLRSVLSGQAPDAFPYDSRYSMDPGLPQRLKLLAELWKDFADGVIGYEEWNVRWADLSAEFEFHR
jgi:ABC-type glycerol-3-phosphate transport system substrate-binding protein